MLNKQVKINNQIFSPALRVVDETGKNLGVMSKEDALKLATEQGLDLIEIVPGANPPIAKIVSYDKFRYQEIKESKKTAATKSGGLKQIRISGRAAENDMRIKAKKIDEFLEEGDKVEIMMVLRGREKYNQEWARGKFDVFLKMITAEYKVTMPQKNAGKGILMQIVKK